MSKLIVIILIAFVAVSTSAQNISFSTGFVKQNRVNAQAVIVDIEGSHLDVSHAFTKWMAEHYDYGLDGSKILENRDHVYSALGTVIPEISDQLIDLHMMVVYDGPQKLRLKFFASYGFDVFFDNENYPFQFRNLYAVVKNFIYEYFHAPNSKSLAAM